MIAKPNPEFRTRNSISIVVSLDVAHSMMALPVEAPLSHARGDYSVAGTEDAPGAPRGMKNGAMQRACGIGKNVKLYGDAPCALLADGGCR